MKNKAPKNLDKIISLLKEETKNFSVPIATKIGAEDRSPFKVLISCILSLRTKDTTTGPATERLFRLAKTPEAMLKLSNKKIEKAIFPVGFYPTKARYIRASCRKLIDDFGGKVPKTMEELKTLSGIGNKCAGLTLIYGYGKVDCIPVDAHVQVIANRLGWVKTNNPDKTMYALMETIPKGHWFDLNNLLVAHGQNICLTNSPFCSRCAIRRFCPRISVKRSR
ncbi:endonuclease III [Candidatus Woesearchaeota archaeon]|nr:endonuclease III [Candidatus Woesearchaeota archaeon]